MVMPVNAMNGAAMPVTPRPSGVPTAFPGQGAPVLGAFPGQGGPWAPAAGVSPAAAAAAPMAFPGQGAPVAGAFPGQGGPFLPQPSAQPPQPVPAAGAASVPPPVPTVGIPGPFNGFRQFNQPFPRQGGFPGQGTPPWYGAQMPWARQAQQNMNPMALQMAQANWLRR